MQLYFCLCDYSFDYVVVCVVVDWYLFVLNAVVYMHVIVRGGNVFVDGYGYAVHVSCVLTDGSMLCCGVAHCCVVCEGVACESFVVVVLLSVC